MYMSWQSRNRCRSGRQISVLQSRITNGRFRPGDSAYGDSWIRLRRVPWDTSQIITRRCLCPRACNDDLSALRIELRRVRLVQSQQLVANEIQSRCERARYRATPLQVLVDNCRSPASARQRRSCHALLINLEPTLCRAVAGRETSAGAFVHPHHDGSLLMGPLLPFGGDGAASWY